jgi:hypothetical protein
MIPRGEYTEADREREREALKKWKALLVERGAIVPGCGAWLSRYQLPAGARVLRLDGRGRVAARRHILDGQHGQREMTLSKRQRQEG